MIFITNDTQNTGYVMHFLRILIFDKFLLETVQYIMLILKSRIRVGGAIIMEIRSYFKIENSLDKCFYFSHLKIEDGFVDNFSI